MSTQASLPHLPALKGLKELKELNLSGIVLLDGCHLLQSRHQARKEGALQATAGHELLALPVQVVSCKRSF